MTITSTTRLEKPLYIWLARIIGIGIVLVSIGVKLTGLPGEWHRIQHQGMAQAFYYSSGPDGTAIVVSVLPEAAQQGIAIGDKLLNPEAYTYGEVGTPVTLRIQRDNLPVREVTFVRRISDQTALGAMLFGWSEEASTRLSLLLTMLPILFGTIAALLICWLKSDDWMALLTAILLANTITLPNTNPYIVIFGMLIVPLVFAWFILFPNGKLAPRWSWVLIFFILPGTYFSSLFDLGILSYTTPYPKTTLLVNLLAALGALGILGIIVFRYRRVFSPVERQQSKWGIYPLLVGFTPSVILGLFSTYYWNAYQPVQALMVSFVSYAINTVMVGMLVSGILFSIFKYRLWDIDFIINRSLVYGTLTILLALVFGGSLFLVSRIVEGQHFVPAFGITAVVAGSSFNPARRRIQRFVDQRFYHINIDYQKTPLEIPSGSATQVLRATQFGVYQNLELIGRGGMAEVYKSTHPQLNQPVAIKILPAQLAEEAEFRQRFTREAQVVSKLEHPNIVRVFDSGEQDGKHYMVMEYLTGQDLDKFIRANGCLSLSQALPLIQQIAAALDYAHAQGFIHRDVKPSNVLLDTSNSHPRAILTDFGITKILNAHTAMTRTGSVMGTFDYIAPEQIQESPDIDGRADIYALGIMVYQMLTGELPFKHNNPGALLIAHLTQPPPDSCKLLPDLPKRICSAIQKAMAKKPEERFATATEFAAELGKN
jgi:protein kinase-like protein